MNTNSPRRYRLKKDYSTPDLIAKAGEIGEQKPSDFYDENCKVWFDNGRYFFYLSQIKMHPTWFEEELLPSNTTNEGERIKVGKMSCSEGKIGYGEMKWNLQFKTNKHIHYDKAVELCNLLENCLNGKEDLDVKMYYKIINEKTYTQQEVDTIRKETWDAARKGHMSYDNMHYDYSSLEDYLKSLIPLGELKPKVNTNDLHPSPQTKEQGTDTKGNFTDEQYMEIWDMIFSVTGYPEGHPKHIDYQKPRDEYAPKEQDTDSKVEWEILSFKVKIGHPDFDGTLLTKTQGYFGVKDFHVTEEDLLKSKIHSIYSVLRKSDGQTFTVGDEIFDSQFAPRKITGFKLWSDTDPQMMILSGSCEIGLCAAKKTDEGKEIYFAEQLLLNNGYTLSYKKEEGVVTKTPFESVITGRVVFNNLIKDKPKGCGICGGQLVLIRGRYPNCDKREVCATCTTERLEQISEISNPDFGKTCQNIN